MLKLKFILPLLIIISALVWWFTPHYSDEDKAYYIAMFCTLTHDGRSNSVQDMQQIIEGSNSDYALQKIHFQRGLGEHLQMVWQGLSPELQQQAHQDRTQCRRLMSEKLLPGQELQG
ncbi:MAG: hypothetical protein QM578_06945 [Pantoea sp.]|uniref:Uncharacterized protein n=1 Tax=Pantoea phytobeneficialis TaxID=2052056 RepID=A0AAP9H8A9_9GAMM|nr:MULTISPECIES: hypothetical protein [Pantoea]ERK11703.1 hypothetical protein L579_0727 [Pantoea sp. AS-PWVM4]MDO6407841.1 hypothetical protein [Pantoea phytobeneficialis]QGR08407.1 hypothetical protein CTZ24_19065 [Pantoea phytobeneficialis]